MFRISVLCIEQDKRQLWHDFSLNVSTGERVGISAPSGYGKTTLGRVLAGWQPHQQGSVTLDEEALPLRGYCPVQLVPQHPALPSTLTAPPGRHFVMLGTQTQSNFLVSTSRQNG